MAANRASRTPSTIATARRRIVAGAMRVAHLMGLAPRSRAKAIEPAPNPPAPKTPRRARRAKDNGEVREPANLAPARRRERARCVAIAEATAEAMGNPALLDAMLAWMRTETSPRRAVARIRRVAATDGAGADRLRRREAGNPNLGSDAPAATGAGWDRAFAKAGTQPRD